MPFCSFRFTFLYPKSDYLMKKQVFEVSKLSSEVELVKKNVQLIRTSWYCLDWFLIFLLIFVFSLMWVANNFGDICVNYLHCRQWLTRLTSFNYYSYIRIIHILISKHFSQWGKRSAPCNLACSPLGLRSMKLWTHKHIII